MYLNIKILTGPLAGQEHLFESADTILVGRSSSAQIRLPSTDTTVSKHHFRIDCLPNGCQLIDLHSRNGVTVNGNKVTHIDLKSGDRIGLGRHLLLVTLMLEENISAPVHGGGIPTFAPARNHSPPFASAFPSPPGYRLLREIGKGAFAQVFQGIRESDGLPVAIKMLHSHIASSSIAVERFSRELHILRKLEHPNIVKILEAHPSSKQPFAIMELSTAGDLRKKPSPEDGFSVQQSVSRICQALAGLSAAHSRGIIHRDIKPANLLIFHHHGIETIKLSDFGHASFYDTEPTKELTYTGEVIGTPEFLAPEQIIDHKNVAEAADQYAIAATLYYLITTEFVYDFPRDTGDKIYALLHSQPIPIQERNPEVPDKLAVIIHRALARNPRERFSNVEEFRNHLLKWTTDTSLKEDYLT